jgi:hypothetical protein
LLDADWKATEELDSRFRGQFSGIFGSPLGPDTIESLAETYLFRQQVEAIKGRKVPDRLREVRDRLPSDAEAKAEEGARRMEEAAGGLPSEAQDLVRMKSREFRDYVRDQLRRQINALLPVIDEVSKLFDPSNLDRDFSRQELTDILR